MCSSDLVSSIGLAVGIATAALIGQSAWAADPPARFSMSPADGGGYVRLDTLTGQMSHCNRRDTQWICTDMVDQGRGLAEEVERLRSDNKNLKAEIRKMEDIMVGGGKAPGPGEPDANRRAEGPAGKFGLPSERDVDQAIDYMERMFRKFRDKMKEFETDKNSTPL